MYDHLLLYGTAFRNVHPTNPSNGSDTTLLVCSLFAKARTSRYPTTYNCHNVLYRLPLLAIPYLELHS